MGLPEVLLAIGTGISAIGTIQQGTAAAAQADAAAKAAEFRAKLAERDAKLKEQAGALEARRQAEEAARQQSTLVAGLGASGVQPGAGAPLLLQVKQEEESELDQAIIAYNTIVGAESSRLEAGFNRFQASAFKSQAKAAQTAGFIGAGSTLLTGFSKIV